MQTAISKRQYHLVFFLKKRYSIITMGVFTELPDTGRYWPLGTVGVPNPFPYPAGHDGGFGAVRKHDRHTGIDLHADPGDIVYACESGIVVAIEWFTGSKADSPWWNDTKTILIEGPSGVLLYGELAPLPHIKEGSRINAGEEIGTLLTVLKQDKGRPMTMLHFEQYLAGTRTSAWWGLDEQQPKQLLDPTHLLVSALPLRK